jgi:hypothetical protein
MKKSWCDWQNLKPQPANTLAREKTGLASLGFIVAVF